jgi:hypothetical protein
VPKGLDCRLDQSRRYRADLYTALVVSLSVFWLFLATLGQPVMTWDEGVTIRREARMRKWLEAVVNPPHGISRERFFREPVISMMWPFAREEPDGHPPFYAVIGNVGWWLGQAWLPPMEAHRLGPVILFGGTCGVMCLFMSRRWGRLAAVAAVSTWVLMPRVFAHAHLASYDGPLACLWFLTVAAFWKAREGWAQSFTRGVVWSISFAVLLAFAAATKFTGWLIPLPLLVWTLGAAARSLKREGRPSVASRACLCLAIPVLLVPFELSLVREIRDIEAGLSGDEDPKLRAKRAADIVRGSAPHPLNAGIYLTAVIWFATYGSMALLRRRGGQGNDAVELQTGSFSSPQPLSTRGQGERKTTHNRSVCPTAETWAAVALVPALTVILVPNWWRDPLRGISIFLWSNLSRQNTTWIPTHFFGTFYEFSLPWYNTLAWTFLTIPPLTLLLVTIGIIATWIVWRGNRTESQSREQSAGQRALQAAGEAEIVQREQGSLAWLLFWNATTLLIIRALPSSPGHDSERQLIGSFPFLACMSGVGVEWLRRIISRLGGSLLANSLAWGGVVVAAVWSAADIWHYRTAPLSYYTELVGGLRGAAKLGLEPTYYWDALDQQAIDWLNANTSAGEKVLFCNYPDTLEYLRLWGTLRVEIDPLQLGITRWYVLQNRPGLYWWNEEGRSPVDRWLAEHGRAAYTHELDGVTLIWIFPFAEYERAIHEAH